MDASTVFVRSIENYAAVSTIHSAGINVIMNDVIYWKTDSLSIRGGAIF